MNINQIKTYYILFPPIKQLILILYYMIIYRHIWTIWSSLG